MQRVDMDFNDINKTTSDIYSQFNYMSLDQVREALRKGSLGEYGLTYKLNTQTVCFWIKEYRRLTNNAKFL